MQFQTEILRFGSHTKRGGRIYGPIQYYLYTFPSVMNINTP